MTPVKRKGGNIFPTKRHDVERVTVIFKNFSSWRRHVEVDSAKCACRLKIYQTVVTKRLPSESVFSPDVNVEKDIVNASRLILPHKLARIERGTSRVRRLLVRPFLPQEEESFAVRSILAVHVPEFGRCAHAQHVVGVQKWLFPEDFFAILASSGSELTHSLFLPRSIHHLPSLGHLQLERCGKHDVLERRVLGIGVNSTISETGLSQHTLCV